MGFLVGLIFGSFLNVLIWRLNDEKAPKFWQGRSMCPHCHHPLSWVDNIPLLSFIFLFGKCRYCKKSISLQYPVVELLTAIVTLWLWPNSLLTILAYCFIVIFFSDLIYGLIPDETILLGIIVAGIINYQLLMINALLGILVALPFTLFAWKGWMGWGDVKLAFLMGLMLGWPKILVALWFGFIIGGAMSFVLLLLRKTKLSATIPLGPFLVVGTGISALWIDNALQFFRFG